MNTILSPWKGGGRRLLSLLLTNASHVYSLKLLKYPICLLPLLVLSCCISSEVSSMIGDLRSKKKKTPYAINAIELSNIISLSAAVSYQHPRHTYVTKLTLMILFLYKCINCRTLVPTFFLLILTFPSSLKYLHSLLTL